MKTQRILFSSLAAGIVVAALSVIGSAQAVTKRFEQPADGRALKPSDLPGYALAGKQCVGCHSAEYMLYQPPNAARPYWTAMVNRMRDVFKAPLAEADMPVIIDYMVKTYGNEQPK